MLKTLAFHLTFSTILFFSGPLFADKPLLALVIDDLGYSYKQAKKVLDLPGQHTFAIIPDATFSHKIANYAHQQEHEVILHMPMQPSPGIKIESSSIHAAMTEEQLTSNVEKMIRLFPFIKGINNHMGSKLTEMAYIMRPVMETIYQYDNNLYFLDSRTTALSQAYQQARLSGLLSLERDIFLDNEHENPISLQRQFDRWLKKAELNGYAIAIAHPHQSSIDFLNKKLPEISDNYKLLTLSQLLSYINHVPEKDPWPRLLSQLQNNPKN